MGGWLKDVSGHYTWSIYFALFGFVCSILFAISLPRAAKARAGSSEPVLAQVPPLPAGPKV
jgi:hypothetical protein